MIRHKNKYSAQSTEYKGERYDSKGEASFARELNLRQRAGEIKSIERQKTIPLIIYGMKIGSVRIDFLVEYADGRKELIEFKGFYTRESQMKYKILGAIMTHEKWDVGFKIVFSDGREEVIYAPKKDSLQ